MTRGWQRCIVAASGPSLDQDVADRARDLQLLEDFRIIAVNDAWRLLPFADVLYACDLSWWEYYAASLEKFRGERWTSTCASPTVDDDKLGWSRRDELRVQLIDARAEEGFSITPGLIHYGNNSGFQAVNLAMQFGAREIRLVGFNMQRVERRAHFFGEHPPELDKGADYAAFIADFNRAAELLPEGVRVINCTRDSALRCFPQGEL